MTGRTFRNSFFVMSLLMMTRLAAAAEVRPHVWDFAVYLDDKPIGYHRFTVKEQGPFRELTTTARFDVKLLFITVYRYIHDATEHWQGNCLRDLKASTNDGGKLTDVKGQPDGERLLVSVSDRAAGSLTGCVMSFAYWNPEILRQSLLLNSQTGEYESIKVTEIGPQHILVRGAKVAAIHYRIDGPKHPIDLWYSMDREWLALESPLDGGRRLRYRLD